MMTVGNLLCGVGVILICIGRGRPSSPGQLSAVLGSCAWLILIAMLFDALDGRIARFTKAATQFGGELDSLADVITFGAAPAVLAFVFLVNSIREPFNNSPVLYFLVAVFPMCAALRLARFNVENDPDEASHSFFKGLPAPAAAGTVASLVLLHLWLLRTFSFYESHQAWLPTYVLPLMVVALSLLMVSTWKYSHIANKVFGQQRSFFFVVLFIFLCILAAHLPEVMLALGFLVYATSGVVGFALDRLVDLLERDNDEME
ncbi:MAG: CDP-diacylglycerol--serine O-phosphatidyltransferase [Planctomycetota bacterium]